MTIWSRSPSAHHLFIDIDVDFFSSPKQSGSPLIEQMLTPNNLPPEILDLMLPVQKNNKIKQNKKEILDPHRPHAASYWL